jgi:hypothetical protein
MSFRPMRLLADVPEIKAMPSHQLHMRRLTRTRQRRSLTWHRRYFAQVLERKPNG